MTKEKFLNVDYIIRQISGTNIETFNELLEENKEIISDKKIYRIAIYLGVPIDKLFRIENNKAIVISRDLLKNHTLKMNYSFKKYLQSFLVTFLTSLASFKFNFNEMYNYLIQTKTYKIVSNEVHFGFSKNEYNKFKGDEDSYKMNNYNLNVTQSVEINNGIDFSAIKYKDHTSTSYNLIYIYTFLIAIIVLRFGNNFYINHYISKIFHEKEEPNDEVVKLCSKKSLENLKKYDKKIYNIVSSCKGNSKEELEKLRFLLIDYHLKLSFSDKITKTSIKPFYLFREDGNLRNSPEEIAEAILYYRFDIFRYGRPVITYFKNRWTNKKIRSSSGKKTSLKKKSKSRRQPSKKNSR